MTKPLLYLLNGNSNAALTARLCGLADDRIAGKAILEAETVAASPPQIVTRRDVVRSAVHILDHVEARFTDMKRARPDAIVLACFGEPGLGALREAVDVPVFGLLESSARRAASLGEFSILTPGAAWPAQLRELLGAYGLAGNCRGISVYSGNSLSEDPAIFRPAIEADCEAAASRDRTGVVILGGALGAGRAQWLSLPEGIRAVDAFLATIDEALATLAAG